MIHDVRWTIKKINQRLQLVNSLVYRKRAPLGDFRFTELEGPLASQPVGLEVDDSDWDVLSPNSHWGGRFVDFAMRNEFAVPADWDADLPVALYLPIGEAGDFSHPEALVYVDGERYGTTDRHHQEVMLPDEWRDGEVRKLSLHGWTGLLGWGMIGAPGEVDKGLFMYESAVVLIDQPTRDFVAAARVALGVAENTDENVPVRNKLLNALDDAFKLLDLREPVGGDAFYASVPGAYAVLREGIERAGASLDAGIVASGHAHIDVAWLWTLGHTRGKSGRTFTTVMRLMDQFPDYHFTQSQPQLYDYLREDYPDLFEEIKEKVAEGRWETIGGMWVEADCNLSGPESLARQFLLGRSFFQEHFGKDVDSPVLWLPDVFGYAWNLPQLIKEAGLEYFFTIKIGWSQYNRLPYDSFWWQGLDGTKVLTHFSTTPDDGDFASTYNANASPRQAIGTWKNFLQKELPQDLLMAFGFGDGGGGPTREMLENIREMGDFPGAPRMKQGPVGDFFRELDETCGDKLPTWNGELYLEIHRGTYTTQSRNKRANRKSEFLLHDAEYLATLAGLVDDAYEYPAQALRKAWELVCLNQFHDIIPGSSITPVYVESLEQYAEVAAIGAGVRDAALATLATKAGGDVLVANPMSFARHDLALWDGSVAEGKHLVTVDGVAVATQPVEEGTLIGAGTLAPYSITSLMLADGAPSPVESSLTATPTLLENAQLRVELNDAGDITRVYDKANDREVLPAGQIANQLQAFEDRPLMWDAWDVDVFYDDKMWLADAATSVTVVEAGPLRATLEVKRRVLNSELVQRISMRHDAAQVDFDTWIDWQDRHIMLKVAFPADVLSPHATYEIQWGNVERPTHRNTSWDWARFETCAQKWVDLSEGDYGISVLNDCKYGHDIRDNVVRISLLRGATSPDPTADIGEQRFSYSLRPHAGSWDEQTVAAAYALNDPLIAVSGVAAPIDATIPALISLVFADESNIIVETVKRAEDGNGIIVRLYESQRKRGEITLRCGFSVAEAARVNIMEETQTALTIDGNEVKLAVHPFEIATVRIVPT